MNFPEDPLLAQVRCQQSVFVRILQRNEFVEKSEELVNLLLRKIGIIAGVLNFEREDMRVTSRDDVRQRIEAGIAHGNAHSVITVVRKKPYKNIFAVETSLAPATKFCFVDISDRSAASPFNRDNARAE